MKIKICGMNNLDNLSRLEALKPDYFGFIFYAKSPRNFNRFSIPEFENTKTVGVFVNEEILEVIKLQKEFQLDAIQLHGDENEGYCLQLKSKLPNGIELFKAISIKDKADFNTISNYERGVDVIILDTKTNLRGGSGKKFNWNLLDHFKSTIPFLLSGGIDENDAENLCNLYNLYDQMLGVDINSKFEMAPGLKDNIKVERFINRINKQMKANKE